MSNKRNYPNPNHFYENHVFMKDLYERAVEAFDDEAQQQAEAMAELDEMETESHQREQMERELHG